MSEPMPPHAPPRPPRRFRLQRPSRKGLVAGLMIVNVVALLGLGVKAYRGDKPVVVVVGITQLAREYMAKLATSNVSPEEAKIRTELFLAVAQEAVRSAANRKGLLVVPRECVLAGEYGDITEDVAKAVEATMAQRTGAVPTAASPAR